MAPSRMVKGFTLIELLIVVALIGVLAGIALPAYQNQVIRSQRADAQISLVKLAQQQERFHSLNNTYATNLTQLTGGAALASDDGHYALSLTIPTACTTGTYTGCFELTATPTGQQAGDSDCTTLSLSSQGVRSATGANTARCWN